MSDDLVNQLTLNYLISKNQLQKLNKRLKETTDTNRRTDREIYGERIKKLFDDGKLNELSTLIEQFGKLMEQLPPKVNDDKLKYLEGLIKECILNTIRESIPIEHLLSTKRPTPTSAPITYAG